MNQKITIRKALRQSGIRNILIAVFVMLFFVALIIAYFLSMYNTEKKNILLTGEMSAIQSAGNFERYLITGTDTVKMTGYTLDQMLQQNCSSGEIHDYIVQETDKLKNAVNDNFTGLYGYIDGQFYDGVDWNPGEDYDPVQRPWYQAAIKKPGETVLVQPYIDAQTGTFMTAVAQTLSDGKSVIALDITAEMIRTIAEEKADSENHMIDMVIDPQGNVLAHSIPDQIGLNYLKQDGSIGAAIVNKLFSGKDMAFELKFEGIRYVVYAVAISKDWYSISVIDSRESFKPLRIMLEITAVVILIIIVILSCMFIDMGRKSLIAETLNTQLASTANIYMSVYDIDLINNTSTEIRSINEKVNQEIERDHGSPQKIFFNIMEMLPDSPTKADVMKFVDFSTLEERLAHTNTVSIEYISFGNLWCRGRFVVSERTDEGKLSHVLWMVENIDEEKRSREKLIDLSERAIAANEAKSEFLSRMSHEIRTPITAILGMNEMVLRECRDEEILGYSDAIRKAGNTLIGIINDILDFSKIESGKMEVIPVDYDLVSMLKDLIDMIRIKAEMKELSFVTDIDEEIPRYLYGDEIRIRQIITNILTNAVKYTNQGSVTLRIGFDNCKSEPDHIMLKVSVKDTGIGIREENIERLFSEFERIEEDRNRSIEGTGLGMNITQSLLKMMGSSLYVQSEYGKGSLFGFALQQKVNDWEAIGDFDKQAQREKQDRNVYQEKFTAPDAHVLIVDDTQMNLMVFERLLKKTLVKIDMAESGFEGIKAARERKYDVIFLDHMMPRKDGIETLKEMKVDQAGLNQDTTMICLTANAVSGARKQYMDAGFDDYLTKPIDPQKLEDMLIKYLPDAKIRLADPEGGDILVEEKDIALPDFLKEIEELDLSKGLQNCGSAQTYLDTLQTYAGRIGTDTDEVELYWLQNDIENVTIKVHALKSTSGIIGATEISELARRLENAGKERDVETLREQIDGLLERCRNLGSKLAPLCSFAQREENLPGMQAQQLQEVYTLLREFASVGDYDSVEEVMKNLSGYQIPEEAKKKVNRLKKAVDDLEYEQLVELLSETE
ncbi:MAG: response regulator [Lachnospiraceae bacterium]|nr:response regulator [Lachnospiraceae bacterium]